MANRAFYIIRFKVRKTTLYPMAMLTKWNRALHTFLYANGHMVISMESMTLDQLLQLEY